MFLKDGEFLQSEQPETYQIVSKKNSNRNKKKKHPILRGIFKTFFILILIAIILVLIMGGFVAFKLYEIAKDAKLSKNDLAIKYENSVVKDMKGNILAV